LDFDFDFDFALCDATLDDGRREYNRKRINGYLQLDSLLGWMHRMAGYIPWKWQTCARMANPMAAALVSGCLDPVCVARQGDNLAEKIGG